MEDKDFLESAILEKYKLSEEEHDAYYEIIKRAYLAGKLPVDNPIAVIVGGQTGAGKSGILGYSAKMFEDKNVIIVNSDEIKAFHPFEEEIAREYPSLYTKITDQESNTWTSRLFNELRHDGYNIIFEGTMKNNRIADESIEELEKLNYTVIVRGLATCDLESRISILERYEGQVAAKGAGRLVVPEHHNQTYAGMPQTIKYIEENKKYDVLEIYSRGIRPDKPERIYAKHNIETKNQTQSAISSRFHVSQFSRTFGYTSAEDAVLNAREEEYERVIPTAQERIKKIKDSMDARNASPVEKAMVLDVLKLVEEIVKKKPELSKLLKPMEDDEYEKTQEIKNKNVIDELE